MINISHGRLIPAEVETAARRAWDDNPHTPAELDAARDHAALLALVHALDRLAPDGELDTARLVADGALAARHRPVLDRWVAEVAERGAATVRSLGGGVRRLRWASAVPSQAQVADAWAAAECLRPGAAEGAALTRFFARACAHLPELLSDTVQAQTLLFEDDSVPDEIYQANEASRYTNAAAAEIVRQLVRDRPVPARIWEIGGGIGATTDLVLDAVRADDLRYHFTDVGRWFLDRALDRWAGRAGLTVGVADINDPELPGRLPAAYDVVLAANVLHNAHDPVAALRRIAACTGGDAWLVMIETGTEHLPLTVSMRFMMSPPEGADGFADERARTGRILLDLPQWHRVLDDAGWSVELALPGERSDHPAARYDQHVLAARRAPGDQNHS